MKTKIIALVAASTLCLSAFCQTPAPWVDPTTVPVVPASVAVSGRQAIANYLTFQIDHVLVQYTGASVVTPGSVYLDANALKSFGYGHRGSFAELSASTASQVFSAQVVPTPDGFYSVQVNVTYYTADNRQVFLGNGWLNIQTNPDGTLTAGQFQPWVNLNSQIAIQYTNYIGAAKWIGHYGSSQDLQVSYDGQNSTVIVPEKVLGDGYFVVSDLNGNVSGWDLSNGTALNGKTVVALLGQTSSSDIRVLQDPISFDAGGSQFYKSGEKFFGRFPLLDVTLHQPLKTGIYFLVPVWGMSQGIAPTRMFVTPVYFEDNSVPNPAVGQEYELPWNADAGGFIMNLPIGGYHIRCEFQGVLDWESDPSPKG
ncbi:hypothetical protein KGQ27_01145 [Patescibacteria group bacterium]|nr:hypothetical protein [Patescibacteria group bacterium]MDE1946549.1 hypothetical protein [Patescibacteria group bacterium]MDE2010890.1 hypothetical protein [Patescibacteria group bacterium]MDE2232774.1 hypothetical protein [Patescibacteria group bacterium]